MSVLHISVSQVQKSGRFVYTSVNNKDECSHTPQIIDRAVSDVHYIDKVKPLIAKVIVGSYVEALTWTHGKPFSAYLHVNFLTSLSCVSSMCTHRFHWHSLPYTTQVVKSPA